jgi:hypothetical protein
MSYQGDICFSMTDLLVFDTKTDWLVVDTNYATSGQYLF